MATERVNAASQPLFAALLRYFQHGDFATFSRAAELAYGREEVSEPYFVANLLYAAQICGLCDVSTATGATRWWVSHSEDIRIQSEVPKAIGTSSEWFATNANRTLPLVTDANLCPLVLGSRHIDNKADAARSIFDLPFGDLVPAFRDIERELCSEVRFSDDLEGHAEAFTPNSGRWNATTLDVLKGSQLIRVRKEYSGLNYYVQHADLGLRFRITQPEWAFVVAYHLLPWRLTDIMTINGTTVRIERAVRLPILMSRVLFSGADAVRVGPIVAFENVRARCIAGVLSYFEAAGDRR